VSSVKDPAADADTHGETPAYVEITGASFTGGPQRVVLSQSFAGDVPEAMPDEDTYTYVGFTLEGRGKDTTVSATCDSDGWRADVDGASTFPGKFSIHGKTLQIALPWDAVGGKGRFVWYSRSSWTRSTLLNTYYAFDTAPNDERGRYP
jgi:hypothetical protein